jgi:hypothetical protein
MTTRFGLAGVSVVAVMLAGTTVARADLLEVDVSTSGGYSSGPIFGPGFVNVTGTAGDFTIVNLTADSTIVSTPSAAVVATNTFDVLSTATVPETLTIFVKQTGYTLPASNPLQLSSDISSSLLSNPNGSTPSATLTSTLVSPGGGGSTPTLTLNGPGEVRNAVSVGQPNSEFEVDQTVTVSLAPGGSAQITATTEAVPEPSRLVGVLSVAGMMGLGLVWRRRMSRTVPC